MFSFVSWQTPSWSGTISRDPRWKSARTVSSNHEVCLQNRRWVITIEMNIFSLWSSYSNVTINYHHYTTGKISIFLCLTSEQFNNLISPCNQNQQYLLQPLQTLGFVSGNIQGWWCCMRKCWKFRNKSLGGEAPHDWLLSNLSVIVEAECLILKHYLIKETAEKVSISIQHFLLLYLVHMIQD